MNESVGSVKSSSSLKYILEYLDIVNEQSCHSSYIPLYSVFLIQYFQYHADLISIQYF